MPAEVVVVKRARRRAFALLWAAPAWVRSVWSSREKSLPEGLHALAEEGVHGATFPELIAVEGDRADGSMSHACNACGACLPACPSGCLRIVAGDGAPTGFDLDPAACIGCGRCVSACPEGALVMRPAPNVLRVDREGRAASIDLLSDVGSAR